MKPKDPNRERKPWVWFVSMPLWVQLIFAAALGIIAALGQAPYNQPIATVLALGMVFLLFRRMARPGQAALIGWAFGFGYFALALIWILEPFQIDVERYGWMAPFALLLLCAGLALFWALAFWAARRLSARTWPLILTWTAAEMLRAYVFTGFPWATPAQVLVEGLAGRSLAWVGPHGANLWMMTLAWVISFPAIYHRRHVMRAGQALVMGVVVALIMSPPRVPDAPLSDHIVRLIQPNVPQALKWNPDYFDTFFQRQLDLSAVPGTRRPALVIWPEAAIPWRLENAGNALPTMADAAKGVPVLFGVNRAANGRLFNALAVIDSMGVVQQTYDKHHTVPFGEYVPFGDLLSRFGVERVSTQEGDGFSRGPGPELLDMGPLGTALPLICYEAVFAHLVGAAPARPDMLIQITNDAWFGQDAGPQQHLAQARMRAIEQGLPLMRAANTGISAMIDPWGRITHSLPLGQAGALDAPLPLPRAPTLYARMGDAPIAALLGLLLTVAVLRKRRARVFD